MKDGKDCLGWNYHVWSLGSNRCLVCGKTKNQVRAEYPYDEEGREMVDSTKEREEWKALAEADALHMLPTEALIASIKHLATRLLEITAVEPQMAALPDGRTVTREEAEQWAKLH